MNIAHSEFSGVGGRRGQAQGVLAFQLPQVLDGQLQHVRFLQLRDRLALGLQRRHHQVFQVIEAFIDPAKNE